MQKCYKPYGQMIPAVSSIIAQFPHSLTAMCHFFRNMELEILCIENTRYFNTNETRKRQSIKTMRV
jgi:hypothetical protein